MHFISHSLNHIMLYKVFSLFLPFYFSSVLHTRHNVVVVFFFVLHVLQFFIYRRHNSCVTVVYWQSREWTNVCTIVIKSEHTREAVNTLPGCHFSVLLILKVCEGIRISHVPPARQTLRWWVNNSGWLRLNLEWLKVKMKIWLATAIFLLFLSKVKTIFQNQPEPTKTVGVKHQAICHANVIWKYKASSHSQCFVFVYVVKKFLYLGAADCWHCKCFIIRHASVPNK